MPDPTRPSSRSNVVPLGSSFEALGRTVGRRRMEVILGKPNAAQLVRALPAEDLYFLIQDVGLEDAAELVALASPEQFQRFLDLDAWRPTQYGPQMMTERVLSWLAVAREGDPATRGPKLGGLDLEIVELLLKTHVRVVDRRDEEENPVRPAPTSGDEDLAWALTPDGFFWIAYPEDPGTPEARRIVEELYGEDPLGAGRLLTAVAWELPSDLEEQALKFRTARMEDMGFPPPEVAASLYARVDPAARPPSQPAPVDPTPGFFLSEFRGESFLDSAAGRVAGVEARTRLDRSLMYLANTVLVADRVDPSDPDAVRGAVARMRAYLEMGLFHLSEGDVAAAGGLLETIALKHAFQVGFTLTLERAWRAEALADELGLEIDELCEVLEAPEAAVVRAVVLHRPAVALALDAAEAGGWPERPTDIPEVEAAPEAEMPGGSRPFRGRGDLERVDRALSWAERQLRFARRAELLVPAGRAMEVARLCTRFATAALRAAVVGAFSAEPLTEREVHSGVARAFGPGGRLTERFRAGVYGAATTYAGDDPDVAARLAARTLARLEDEIGPVLAAGTDLDPAMLTCVRLAGP